jgi:hypothetical protein
MGEQGMRAAWITGVGAWALIGCAAHVDLQAPPASAPVQTRLDAYEKLESLSYHQSTITTIGRFGSSTTHSTDYMQLANGTRVYYPEDVLPVVPEDSPTAVAAQASQSKRDTARILTLASIVSAVAGVALIVLPFTQSSAGHVSATPIFIGLGVGILGGSGFGFAAHAVGESSQDEAATAYETYDSSLLQRLGLCASGSGATGCRR